LCDVLRIVNLFADILLFIVKQVKHLFLENHNIYDSKTYVATKKHYQAVIINNGMILD